MGFRAPKINWEQQIENILDQYGLVYDLFGVNKSTAISHAIQKDAVQNCIDAENIKNPDKWSVEFKLQEDRVGNEIVTITDTGTFGLTGEADIEDEELLNLSIMEQLKERWARFESLAYKNPDEKAIGARGQGKFIFIGNSKDKEMIYETLRQDGIHRVGHWITKGRGGKTLIDPLKGDEAKKYLKKKISLLPLKEVGTRITIINPKRELVESFKPLKPSPPNKCDLAKYISETWWELLFDKNKKIFISMKLSEWPKVEKIIVFPPELYKKFKENPNNFKSRIIENKKIRDGIKIKEFVVGFSEEEIPAELRGISIQRGRMKVASFDIRDGNEHIKEKYKKHIFGWIILNEEGEKELRKTESPHHYGFKKSHGSLAQEIFGLRGWLSKEIKEFAEEKLGILSKEKREMDLGRTHIKVLNILNKLMRSLGYRSSVKSGLGKGGGGGGENKLIRIQMPPIKFPGPMRRVEFNEKVSEIRSRIVNDTKKDIYIKLKITLESASKSKKLSNKSKKIVKIIDKLEIASKSKSEWYGPYSILFSKKFKPGKYILKAEIISLETKNKGEIYYKITRAIYLGIDPPPAIGMFKKFDEVDFFGEDKKLKYKIEEEGNKSLTMLINVLHPSWRRADTLKNLVSKNSEIGGDPIEDYYLGIGLSVAVEEDLRQKANFLGKEGKNFQKILKRDMDGLFEKTLANYKKIQQEILFDALSDIYKY